MKTLTLAFGTLALVASHLSFAAPCDKLSLQGEVQIIPLDGTITVMGRLDLMDLDVFDTTNPITAEAQADGSIALNVYETIIPPKIGTLDGTAGTIRLESSRSGCEMIWSRDGRERTLELVSTSANGDLILSDKGTPNRAPTLVIKKINKK